MLETVPATPDPLHVTFDADPSLSGSSAFLSGSGAFSASSGGTLAVRPAHLETRNPFDDGRSPPPAIVNNRSDNPQIVVSCSSNEGGAIADLKTRDVSLPTDASYTAARGFFYPDFSPAMSRTETDGCIDAEKTIAEDDSFAPRAPSEKGRSDHVSMTAPLAGVTGEGIYATSTSTPAASSMPTPLGSASTCPTSSSPWTSGDDDGTALPRNADALTVNPDWQGEVKEGAATALLSERVVIQKHEQRLIVKTPEGEESEKVIVSRFSKSREASPALARRSSLRSSQSAGNIVGGEFGGGLPSQTLSPRWREEDT